MAFDDELLAMTGASTDSFDIRAAVRRCYLYDFTGAPVRLWDGQGVLVADGQEWLGTMDATGINRHRAPTYRDPRDGTAPRYEFSIPFLDRTTHDALKADQALAMGRDMICYNVLCKVGEGLIPTTALRWNYRLAIRGVQFGEHMEGERGRERKVYSASVIAKSLEYGRSKVPAGTMTDTAQRERARVIAEQYGIAAFDDSGCSFVSANSKRTFVLAGT
jgi:hypothetical protein